MITGKVSQADYLSAIRLHRATLQRLYYIIGIAAVGVGGITYLYGYIFGLVLIGAGVGGVIGEFVTSVVYWPWKARHLHNQQKDLASTITYEWDSTFLSAKSDSGQSKREWKNYNRYKEDGRVFLLYLSDHLFEVFPKHWFQNEEQIASFRELANLANSPKLPNEA